MACCGLTGCWMVTVSMRPGRVFTCSVRDGVGRVSAGVVGPPLTFIGKPNALALVQRLAALQVMAQDQRDQVGSRPSFFLGQFVHLSEKGSRQRDADLRVTGGRFCCGRFLAGGLCHRNIASNDGHGAGSSQQGKRTYCSEPGSLPLSVLAVSISLSMRWSKRGRSHLLHPVVVYQASESCWAAKIDGGDRFQETAQGGVGPIDGLLHERLHLLVGELRPFAVVRQDGSPFQQHPIARWLSGLAVGLTWALGVRYCFSIESKSACWARARSSDESERRVG